MIQAFTHNTEDSTRSTHTAMVEVRFHGRGGQGAVIASTILASACGKEDKYVQSFPLFGFERRGAPVTAFTRISNDPILLRCQVYTPDHVVVLDQGLLDIGNITAGLKPGGWIIINTDKQPSYFNFADSFKLRFKVATVDATTIAAKYRLGSRASRIVNTAILGALAKATAIVDLASVIEAVKQEVPAKVEANVAAVKEAYDKANLG